MNSLRPRCSSANCGPAMTSALRSSGHAKCRQRAAGRRPPLHPLSPPRRAHQHQLLQQNRQSTQQLRSRRRQLRRSPLNWPKLSASSRRGRSGMHRIKPPSQPPLQPRLRRLRHQQKPMERPSEKKKRSGATETRQWRGRAVEGSTTTMQGCTAPGAVPHRRLLVNQHTRLHRQCLFRCHPTFPPILTAMLERRRPVPLLQDLEMVQLCGQSSSSIAMAMRRM